MLWLRETPGQECRGLRDAVWLKTTSSKHTDTRKNNVWTFPTRTCVNEKQNAPHKILAKLSASDTPLRRRGIRVRGPSNRRETEVSKACCHTPLDPPFSLLLMTKTVWYEKLMIAEKGLHKSRKHGAALLQLPFSAKGALCMPCTTHVL